jgi:hypothetical protein
MCATKGGSKIDVKEHFKYPKPTQVQVLSGGG